MKAIIGTGKVSMSDDAALPPHYRDVYTAIRSNQPCWLKAVTGWAWETTIL